MTELGAPANASECWSNEYQLTGMTTAKLDGRDHAAARATLVALRAALPNPQAVRPNCYVLLPSSVPLSQDQASQELARLPKPLVCVGFSLTNCLFIGAWEISLEENRKEAFIKATQNEMDWIRHQYAVDAASRFLIRGYAEETLLTPEEFETWLTSYDLVLANSITDRADRENRRLGIVAVTSFRPPGTAGLAGHRTRAS